MLRFIAGQIGPEPTALADYAQRDQTRREHQQELLTAFGWKTIDRLTYRVLSIDLLRACNCCMKVSKLITSQ
jgi:hypothetical protein